MSLFEDYAEPAELIMKNGEVYGKIKVAYMKSNRCRPGENTDGFLLFDTIMADGEAPINNTDLIRFVNGGETYLIISAKVETMPRGHKFTFANVIPYRIAKN